MMSQLNKVAAADGAGAATLRAGAVNRHLVLLNTGSPLHRLFIIPGTGGLSDGLGQLGVAFGNSMTVYGIQMPGTGEGEKPCRSIRALARKCIHWMREVQPEGPYWLMGYSFGGHVAYEMARQLEEKKLRVGMVTILDTRAGVRGVTLDDTNKVDFVLRLAADYFWDFKIIEPPYPEWALQLDVSLAKLPVDEMVPHLREVLIRHLPEDEMAIGVVSRLVNLRVANAQMTYTPPGTIEAPLIVFKTRQNGYEGMDDSLGWAPFGTSVQSCLLPGNHDMLNNENPSAIAGYLKSVPDFP
jgi:surfactin synthase thioesterase subunit